MVTRNTSKIGMWALIILLLVGGGACKSKKKAMAARDAAAEKAKMEQEAKLRQQQEQEEADRKRQEEMEAKARAAEAARKEREPYTKLAGYFNSIGNSSTTAAANSSINEALSLFASRETPVLIVIHESGGQKDYDRPTTIGEYLNYLKDQKKKGDSISNLKFDSSGKITEVELVKK